ncbi:heme ABC transporter ATP-binding protein [Echinimonas agarilytica]|uniref:Heme ABC transporter ATP-binding protein n=1 Tax=Echinimonas agarilytica TaxID=1215918 RepID=A0AA41W6V7_9GAMM|nr:heme ABC transporter ATP-binding protein [Echinimonas agarilytica]MCM2679603.1 heme ABC transporter ATP-binding protein [Echinimonas agarilytica]
MFSVAHLKYAMGEKNILNVDLAEANSGDFIALLGTNGAGKSTFLKSMTGELMASGSVSFYGRAREQWNRQALAKQLAVLPQASELSFPFTAQEVVELGLIPLSYKQQDGIRVVRESMQKTSVWDLADRLYSLLSGGERQRVHLARVLVQLSQASEPPILLLDEPTSAQDLAQQHDILSLLKQLCDEQQWCVVAIVHDLNQALRFCNRTWLIHDSELIAEGAPEQVLNLDTIEKVWGYRGQLLRTDDQQLVFI